MMWRGRRRRKPERLTAWRDRLIAETELALLVGLRFPERVPRIPFVVAGTGEFDPDFALQFWAEALDVDESELTSLGRPEETIIPALRMFDPDA